jgi:hypothetical protein
MMNVMVEMLVGERFLGISRRAVGEVGRRLFRDFLLRRSVFHTDVGTDDGLRLTPDKKRVSRRAGTDGYTIG